MVYNSLVVVGSLTTDIVASGAERFPNAGEYAFADTFRITPGGKGCNIALMAAALLPPDEVAMVSVTSKDDYGLWKLPYQALRRAGVNTRYVAIKEDAAKLPSLTLITVDREGRNQVIALPGVCHDLGAVHIDAAHQLFTTAGSRGGYSVCTLECGIEGTAYAIQKAKAAGLRVIFDPGGIADGDDLTPLLQGIYLLKPNEHEAKMLTGINVVDLASAQRAASALMRKGVENVLITVGASGAYLFTPKVSNHIPAPKMQEYSEADETGCGDQVLAVLCASLYTGKPLEASAIDAIIGGTLQFYHSGIQPLDWRKLQRALLKYSTRYQKIHNRKHEYIQQ